MGGTSIRSAGELSKAATERMQVNHSNVPDSLALIETGCEEDPNSIHYIRQRAYAWSQGTRLFRRKFMRRK